MFYQNRLPPNLDRPNSDFLYSEQMANKSVLFDQWMLLSVLIEVMLYHCSANCFADHSFHGRCSLRSVYRARDLHIRPMDHRKRHNKHLCEGVICWFHEILKYIFTVLHGFRAPWSISPKRTNFGENLLIAKARPWMQWATASNQC